MFVVLEDVVKIFAARGGSGEVVAVDHVDIEIEQGADVVTAEIQKPVSRFPLSQVNRIPAAAVFFELLGPGRKPAITHHHMGINLMTDCGQSTTAF